MTVPAHEYRRTGLQAVLWMALFALAWGAIERFGVLFSRVYPAAEVIALRYSAHLVILAGFCLAGGRVNFITTRRPGWQIARAFFMFLMPATFILAPMPVTSVHLWGAFWLAPLVVVALGAVWLKERISAQHWLLVLAGYAAAILLLDADIGKLGSAAIYPLTGALGFAGYVVATRYLRDEPVHVSLFYTGLISLACMFAVAGSAWQPVATGDIGLFTAIGTVSLAALYALDRALEIAPAAVIAPLLYDGLLVEVVIDALRFHEWPPLATMAGSLLLIAVASFACYRMYNKSE